MKKAKNTTAKPVAKSAKVAKKAPVKKSIKK